MGPIHGYGPYYLNGVVIDSVDSQKDLGVLFDNQLRFHHHTTTIVAKANRLPLGLIKRSFDHLNSDMLTKLFVTIVATSYTKILQLDMGAIIYSRSIEKVQHRATKMLPAISDKSYEERLSILKLPSLTYRRHIGDMILLYKVLNHFNSDFSSLYTYSTTRGHQFKLFKY